MCPDVPGWHRNDRFRRGATGVRLDTAGLPFAKMGGPGRRELWVG